MAQSLVPGLRVLPGITSRRFIAFNPKDLSSGVGTFTRELLTQTGQLSKNPGFFESRSVDALVREAEPRIRLLVERFGDKIDVRLAADAIDRAQFRMEAKKTDRRAWLVSGGIFFGALLGFAAAGYGIGLGFKTFFSPALAEGIQAGWNPVWYTVGGGIVGAMTSLFNDKVTAPVRAWINRIGFKGAPVQAADIKNLTSEFIFSNMVEGTADGRFNGGRFAATVFLIHSKPTFRAAGNELRAAKTAASADEHQTAVEIAAMHIGGFLVNSEMYWFNFDPHNIELFEELRRNLWPNFARASAEDLAAFRKGVLDHVRANRKNVESQGRATVEEAIKNYYDPFLDRILVGPPKTDTQPQPLMVAHAG